MDEEKNDMQHDDMYTISYSESMEIRNVLRSKLVQAQGKETDRIPMFVSWPGWLDDGIVCLYVNDLKEILRNTVRETAHALLGTLDGGEEAPSDAPLPTEKHVENDEDAEAFTPMSPMEMNGTMDDGGPRSENIAPDASPQRPVSGNQHQPREQQAPSAAPPPSETPRTATSAKSGKRNDSPRIGNILDQDDIEQLIQEEMNKKKH